MMDMNRIKSIAKDLCDQFDCPELNPVLIQTSISEEDEVFICENRKEIYQLADVNENCAILLTYMMVHLAFNEYDEAGFWNHFRNFIGIPKEDRKKAFDPVLETLDMYGFRVYSKGNRQLVKSLLFNAGVPKVQATVFFNTMYEFYKKYSGLISDRLDDIVKKVECYYQDRDYSIIGFATVREFLGDSEYSGELIRNVLRKIDQVFNNPDEIFTIDLGLLEESFDQWYREDRLIRKKTGNLRNGLMIDVNDYDIYYVAPSVNANNITYCIAIEPELSEEHQVSIKTTRTPDGIKTVRSKLRLGDYPILDGVRICHDNETLFSLPESKYLTFDKDGFLRKQLSTGNNIIVGPYELLDESDLPISQILDEKDNYCVYRTLELSTGDTFEIMGEVITLGSNNDDVIVEANRIKNRVKFKNKPVDALYSHPRIVLNSEFKHTVIRVYRNDGLIYNASVEGSSLTFDPNTISELSIKNGVFRIRIKSGSKVFNYEYVCINDFRITFDSGSDINQGSFLITVNGETKSFDYGETDYNILAPMKIANGLYIEVDVRTPVIAFQYKPSEDIWCYPSSEDKISSSDVTRNFTVSYGFEDRALCCLQFISDGKKVVGDEYARSHNGLCRFKIHHVNEITGFKNKLDVIYVDGSGNKHSLITLNDVPDIEVDDQIGGVCVFTLTSLTDNKDYDYSVQLKASIDGRNRAFSLTYNEPVAIAYLYNLDYEVLEIMGDECRLIRCGYLSTSNSHADDYKDEDKLVELANDGDADAQLFLAKKMIKKHNYSKAYPYLMGACGKEYSPAYLEAIYYYLFFNDENCEKNIAPYFNKLKDNRSATLLYDIEKMARPKLNEFEDTRESL